MAAAGFAAGELIQLADTGLRLRVPATGEPADGWRLLTGLGLTGRDGIGLKAVPAGESCDAVLTNVLVVDPVLGVRLASVGIRQGRISGVGRAGNPDVVDGVEVLVGTGTIVIPGDGLIATPGVVDSHVHLLSPRVCEAALASGVTTILGQEIGPFWGVGVGSAWALGIGYRSLDAWPVNIGLLGRGSSSRPEPILEALEAGVCALKVHEDVGAAARALDTALVVADERDVQVCLHSDGLNEGLSVADTLAVLDGRTVHAYHVEGCGGGHVPDVLELAGVPNVLASSTNPTLPFARDAVAESAAMISLVHGPAALIDGTGSGRLAADRVRAVTMAAETALHERGLIGITSSDAQGMGRAGETVRRTFALAAVTAAADGAAADLDGADAAGRPGARAASGPGARAASGPGARAAGPDHNDRVLRYLAKLTINPAIAHGISHEVGSLEPGKLADIVLWHPAWFGAKPHLVIKGGLPAWGAVGDPNAAIETAQPVVLDRQFGGVGGAAAEVSALFVNAGALDAAHDAIPSRRRRVAVRGTRGIGVADLVGVRAGSVRVAPDGTAVTLDGEPVSAEPADRLPLARLYHL